MMTVRLGAVLSGLILSLFVTNTLPKPDASNFFLFMAVTYILAAVLSLGMEHANTREAATESFQNSKELLASHIGKRSFAVFCFASLVTIAASAYISVILDSRLADFSILINACSLIVATALFASVIQGYGYASTSIFLTRLLVPLATIVTFIFFKDYGVELSHSFVLAAGLSSICALMILINLRQSDTFSRNTAKIGCDPKI